MPARSATDERASRVAKESPAYKGACRTLGARVRELRHGLALTLEQAAERMAIDLKHLQKIEAGQLNVTLVTLVRISEGLGVPLLTLFLKADGEKAKVNPKRRPGK